MRDGLYAIDMPVDQLLEFTVLADIISEVPIQVENWTGLRRDVREGQEIMLVGSVPEQEAVIQLHAIVAEFDDDMQLVKVVI